MPAPVDLQELIIERRPLQGEEHASRRHRKVISHVLIPTTILCGFAAVLCWSFRDSYWPATRVTVVSVIASRAEVTAADTPLFQAAGWIEPRPQPVIVSSLVEGIVDEVLVVEGQPIEANQIVVRLIRRDAEIMLRRTEANVRLREAEVAATRATLVAAEALHAEPIPLIVALADSEAALAKMETELARLPALMRAAEAKRDFSEKEVAGKTGAGDGVAGIALRRAKSDLEIASALIDEYRQQAKSFEREHQTLAKRREVLARQLELKIDETRRVAETRAQLQVAEAQLQQAHADRDAAQLNLERTDVRAKTAGHVLTLVAKPGSRLMGIDRAATHDASTVLTMYDPAHLQVRADVRLEDVPAVLVGQPVRIETPVHPQSLTGHVLMATAMTDIQKNTLQVKVAIDNPPGVLKPDMLVQTTFMSSTKQKLKSSTPPLRLLAPRELIQGSGDNATAWVADQSSRTAKLRRLTIGATTADGLVEITTGVNVGDRLIVSGRESLTDGVRIQIMGDDATLGRETSNGTAANASIKSSQIHRTGRQD